MGGAVNAEDEAHLKSIVGSLIEAMEFQKQVQADLLREVATMLNTQGDFLRRIEILELRLDIEEPKE